MPASFTFDRFVLDTGDRRLKAGGEPVELNTRYFDALALLVNEQGRLVAKERFLAEVWDGVPVTDEALTQCISTLRRQLGDNASRPRFIETVPKHGYRFIAPVTPVDESAAAQPQAPAVSDERWRKFMTTGIAGTIGAVTAGAIGGLVYGFASASQPVQSGVGAISVLLVLLFVTILVAVIGGAGVSFGIAAARLGRPDSWRWPIAGGAGGGLIVGALGKLLGLDAFTLLVGRSPGDITGAAEGAVLGAVTGLALVVAMRARSVRSGAAIAGVAGAAAGAGIAIAGGRLMLGSLELLAHGFPGSRLQLDRIDAMFGEAAFGPVTRVATAAVEAGLFTGCVVGAMLIARRASRLRNR
jgi:DNA-binding winged helix-turn-helix (wHTH) protein